MKRTQKILMAEMLAGIVASVLPVVFFESNTLEAGAWAGKPQLEFVVLSAMELLVLCAIPVALRLFKFTAVHGKLTSNPAPGLLRWGTLRMMMLVVPMVACTLFYYMFFMKAPFGYMAVILLLCLAFVVPTKERCKAETSEK